MIIYEKGDLFKKLNEVESIINTVNCVGVMGKGIALEFKKRYPENFQEYKTKCFRKELTIGNSFVYEIPYSKTTKFIINFPTKKHWRNPSKIEYIEEGLDNLIELIAEYNIKSVAMPPLGCGNGNLDWDIVKPLIEKKLTHLTDVKIIVFEPPTKTPNNSSDKKKKPRLTKDQKKLLLLMNDYNNATKGPLLTHIETNIISYFLYFKNNKMKFELKTNGPHFKQINNIILLLSSYYIEPLQNTQPNLGTQIKILNTNVPNKKEILADADYQLVKNLIKGFENYNDLMVLSITHWFKFIEKVDTKDLLQTVSTWLKENEHSNIDKSIIQKSINRLDTIYFQTENLKLF